MQQNNDKNQSINSNIKETGATTEARPVRTFIDDIARLKKENKLTQKDISQIAPNIINKIRQLDETRNKEESSDEFYQRAIKQETDKFAGNTNSDTPKEQEPVLKTEKAKSDTTKGAEKQKDEKSTRDISSLSPQFKYGHKTKISRLEEITRNIESKYFSEETKHPKPATASQQETNNSRINEVKITADKPEEKKEATPYEKIEDKKTEFEKAVLTIQKEKEGLEIKRLEIKEERSRIEIENKSRKELETEIEKQENELRKQKNEAENAKMRQELEKQRQNKEDERQRIEMERWNADQTIANLDKRIEDIRKEELVIAEKEARNKEEIRKWERKQLAIRARAENLETIKKLADTKKMRAELETEWKVVFNKTKEARDERASIEKRKNIIETEIQALEMQEHKVTDPTEIHKFEEARWKKDKELRGLEEESLIAEEKEASLEESLTKIETKSREVIHTEQEILDKVAEIDRIISASEQDIKNTKQP